MKTPKFGYIYQQGPFFILPRFRWPLEGWLLIGLLDYWHILALYFAIALPVMSSPSLRISLTKAALLSRANQPSNGGNHPIVAAQLCFFGKPGPYAACAGTWNIALLAAVHPYFIGLHPSDSLGLVLFWCEALLTILFPPAAGLEPTPVSVIKPLTITQSGIWCQRVESNHWPLPYEGSVLTDWTTRAYVCALCVDSSHT